MRSPLDMLVFAKVVELESFSRAAQRLGISRSAASKHVSRLEAVLGARLLNRTTRKLSLTEAGSSIREHCRRMAAEVEASEISVQPFVSRPQGLLRVSAPGAFGRMHLVPLLPEFLALHPDISIDLVLSDQLVDLVAQQFDVAISSSPLATANLIRRELVPIRMSICAAPSYLQSSGAPTRPDELHRHNCIYYASAAVRGDHWTFRQNGESHTVQVKGNFRANNSEAVRDAAVSGIGVALLPTFAIWREINAGTLLRLMPDWTPLGTFGQSLTAHFISDRHLTPKIRTLIDFLVERFGRTPHWDQSLADREMLKSKAGDGAVSRPVPAPARGISS
jgi:DNA-binding transcriptional LysR family regulator